MGASAVVVSLRRAVERGPAVSQTDDALVARVRAGDEGAFEAIYDRYARGVLAFCVHMLGNREEAEDALQLTFVSAYRGLRRSRNEIALRPWLYTIARNRCLSELRVRREAVDTDGVVAERSSAEGLADQVQRREDLRELVEDMQRLPEDQRAALVLFEMGDHSHQEIADVLGIRADKVKALIFQAREGLVRGRRARERPCVEIRELLATSATRVLPRSMARAHIDRCPSCAAFEDDVHRQRTALALILPVAVSAELKTTVLSAVFGGGGAAGVGAAGVGTTGAAATAAIAGTQSVAVVASGVVAAATLGLGGVDPARLMAKLLTAAAIATGAAGPGFEGSPSQGGPPAVSRTAPASSALAPASSATGPTIRSPHGPPRTLGVPHRAGWTAAPGQALGSGTTGSGSSPARVAAPGQSPSAPGLAGVTQTVASPNPGAPPRDIAGAGSTSAASGRSGVAQTGPPSPSPGQSGTAQSAPTSSPGQSGTAPTGPPSSPPGQSGAAHGNGPPTSPPGQSGTAQSGQPSSSPGNSGSAHGNGPPSSPPGQSGAAPGGPPATAGPPPDPASSSSPGNSGNAPGHTGASNGQGGPPATKP